MGHRTGEYASPEEAPSIRVFRISTLNQHQRADCMATASGLFTKRSLAYRAKNTNRCQRPIPSAATPAAKNPACCRRSLLFPALSGSELMELRNRNQDTTT